MLGRLNRFRRTNGGGNLGVEGLCSVACFNGALEKERYRSDRSDHPYSLLVLTLPPAVEYKGSFQRAVTRMRERLRAIDEVGWYGENQIGIILPYTHRDGAEQVAEEICTILSTDLAHTVCLECEIYSYAPGASDNSVST